MARLTLDDSGQVDWKKYQDELASSSNPEEAAKGRHMNELDRRSEALGNIGKNLNPGDIKERELTDPKLRAAGKDKAADDEFNKIAKNYDKTAEHPLGDKEGKSPHKGLDKDQLMHGLGKKKNKSFMDRHKKEVVFLGAGMGGFLLFFGIIIVLLLTLAPYRNVHFATVLRSIGMARFTYVMNKQFSRTIFDSAVLTKNSTGRFVPPESSMFHKLIGVNPRRQLYQLGHQNKLRFDFEGTPRWGGALGTTNTFKGVTINNDGQTRSFYLDDTAKELYNKNYNNLSRSEARKVRSAFGNQVHKELASALSTESRRFRWGTYKGFYQATGIKLFKWKNKASEYKLKNKPQADALNLKETVERVNGGELKIRSTGNPELDKEAQQELNDKEKARRNNTLPGERRSKLADSVRGVRGLSAGVAVTTIACVMHSLQNAFEDAGPEREARVARTNNETQSAADQTMYGDTQNAAVGAVNDTWNGAEQSALYQQFQGRAVSSKESLEEVRKIPGAAPPTTKFASVIEFTDQVLENGALIEAVGGGALRDAGCTILLNKWVQYGIVGVEGIIAVGTAGSVTAGIQVALRTALEVGASIGLAELVGTLIDDAIHASSNTDFTGLSEGKEKFDENYVASDYTQQVGNRQITFGAPMTAADANAAQLEAVADLRDYYSEQPFKTRYFAIDNPFSLTGYVVAHTPSTLGDMAQSLQSGVASLASIIGSPQRLFGAIANIFTSHSIANAGTVITRPDMFGVDEWGWTPAELKRVEEDPAFEIANPEGNDLIHSIEPRVDALNEKYGPCYAKGYVLQDQKPDQCTRDFLTSDEALKWRTYMAYAFDIAHLTGPI